LYIILPSKITLVDLTIEKTRKEPKGEWLFEVAGLYYSSEKNGYALT